MNTNFCDDTSKPPPAQCFAPQDTDYPYATDDTNDARRAEATALNTMAGFNGIGCGYQAGVGLAAPISIPLDVRCDWESFWGEQNTVSLDCAGVRNGNTPDCPSSGADVGQCMYKAWQNGEWCYAWSNPNPIDKEFWKSPCQCKSSFCTKLAWDAQMTLPCCLGSYTSQTSITRALAWGTVSSSGIIPNPPPVSEQALFCDPRWCPGDPYGACEGVFADYCASRTLNSAGVPVMNLLHSASVCNQWYIDALAGTSGNAPATRWPVLDNIMTKYCTTVDGVNDPACACMNYGFKAATSKAMFTSVSGTGDAPASTNPQPNDKAPGVRSVQPINSATGEGLNISDYACIAPECVFNPASPQVLIPFDVWFSKNYTCPTDICLTVVDDGTLSIGTIQSGGAAYIGVTNVQCANPYASITKGTPLTRAESPQVSSLFLDTINGGCVGGPCSESPITLVFANGSSNTDLVYTLTTAQSLPPWLQYTDPNDVTGTISSDGELKQVLLAVAENQTPPPGVHTVTFSIANTLYPNAPKKKVDVLVNAIAVTDKNLPKPPPPPNPGVAPRTMPLYVAPWWVGPFTAILVLVAFAAMWLRKATQKELKELIPKK